MLKVTTSWDDGDILDKRLAALLSKYGVKGTFYITKNYREKRLSDSDIKELAQTHEIGAHTLTHPDLRSASLAELRNEITGSKSWLEGILGKKIAMFCYPKGLYDNRATAEVKDAGFVGARTTKLGTITDPDNPFLVDTTIQIYPFPFRKISARKMYWRKIFEPLLQRFSDLSSIGVSFFSMSSWLTMAKATFDQALKNGHTFHLWGHSWEIEKYGMWEDLEKFLQYISKHEKNCVYVTNSELINPDHQNHEQL